MSVFVRSIPLLILSVVALFSARLATAQSVATNPVGYNVFNLPAGNSLRVNTFVQPTAYQSTAASYVSGTTPGTSVVTISSSGSALTSGTYNAGSSGPIYYMEVLTTGSAQGLIVDVISNGTNTITVNANLANFGVTQTTSFCIRPHTTLASLFPANCGLTSVDSVKLFFPNNTSQVFSFTGSGDGWAFGNVDVGGQIIYPAQGFIITTQGAESVSIMGYVKPGPTIVPLYAGALNAVGTVNPMLSGTQTLSTYNLPAALGLFDTAKVFTDDGTLSCPQGAYVYNGTAMVDGSGNNVGSTTVNPGDSLVVNVQNNEYLTLPSFYTSGN